MGTLEFERAAFGSVIERENIVRDVFKLARNMKRNGKPLSKDPIIRQKLAQFYIDVNVVKTTAYRTITRQLRGEPPGPETQTGALLSIELGKRLEDFAMELQGPFSRLTGDSKYAIDQGAWQRSFLRSRGNSIESGTIDIKRNLIAENSLGLPRAGK